MNTHPLNVFFRDELNQKGYEVPLMPSLAQLSTRKKTLKNKKLGVSFPTAKDVYLPHLYKFFVYVFRIHFPIPFNRY